MFYDTCFFVKKRRGTNEGGPDIGLGESAPIMANNGGNAKRRNTKQNCRILFRFCKSPLWEKKQKAPTPKGEREWTI